MLSSPVSLRPNLTPAEITVAHHVCAGLSNKEIATALGKAEPTIKHQVSAILRKTGHKSRSAYIVAALRSVSWRAAGNPMPDESEPPDSPSSSFPPLA